MVTRRVCRLPLQFSRCSVGNGEDPMFIRSLILMSAFMLVPLASAEAQQVARPSMCLAMAQPTPNVIHANLPVAASGDEVTITYAGHSTYVIETPAGVRIATDYSGIYGSVPLPDVVTMNKAHSTHHTMHPDPAIEHVLHGWGAGDEP